MAQDTQFRTDQYNLQAHHKPMLDLYQQRAGALAENTQASAAGIMQGQRDALSFNLTQRAMTQEMQLKQQQMDMNREQVMSEVTYRNQLAEQAQAKTAMLQGRMVIEQQEMQARAGKLQMKMQEEQSGFKWNSSTGEYVKDMGELELGPEAQSLLPGIGMTYHQGSLYMVDPRTQRRTRKATVAEAMGMQQAKEAETSRGQRQAYGQALSSVDREIKQLREEGMDVPQELQQQQEQIRKMLMGGARQTRAPKQPTFMERRMQRKQAEDAVRISVRNDVQDIFEQSAADPELDRLVRSARSLFDNPEEAFGEAVSQLLMAAAQAGQPMDKDQAMELVFGRAQAEGLEGLPGIRKKMRGDITPSTVKVQTPTGVREVQTSYKGTLLDTDPGSKGWDDSQRAYFLSEYGPAHEAGKVVKLNINPGANSLNRNMYERFSSRYGRLLQTNGVKDRRRRKHLIFSKWKSMIAEGKHDELLPEGYVPFDPRFNDFLTDKSIRHIKRRIFGDEAELQAEGEEAFRRKVTTKYGK